MKNDTVAEKVTVIKASQGEMEMLMSKSQRIVDIYSWYFDGPVTLEIVESEEAGLRLDGTGYAIDVAKRAARLSGQSNSKSEKVKRVKWRTRKSTKKSAKKSAEKPEEYAKPKRTRGPLTTSDPADWEDCT